MKIISLNKYSYRIECVSILKSERVIFICEGEMLSEIIPRQVKRKPTSSRKKKKKKLHRLKSQKRDPKGRGYNPTEIITEDNFIME